ncbi:hypothetical protein ENUP19_0180G0011 [Entamoeba nuttalli]|uniref:Cysteine proteinase, putative n=2 Tax=Entamoeba nuttalli TaxID=412467 RepID=K2GVD4_ENTNP|nr:cysteine proteinase, putative [Entamoeba nuttalli P19]EKE39043.1 cysteine proteinase, putative [Entamoeba nuttalli P19]|eukprot:XP_008858622.1 cysteine proteinase, putative [Entamoeba nuttalli P19]
MFNILLLVVAASAIDFKSWAAKNNKHFTAVEALRRRAIFNMNAKFVAKFNKEHSFELTVEGPFAAMTNQEYNNLLKAQETEVAADSVYDNTIIGDSSKDWRAEGKVTPVRDQGGCGSCYSFSSLAVLESRLLIAGSKYNQNNLDLSEQQIVDCSTANNGCNGGSLAATYLYVKNNGVTDEASYPYTATKGTCKAFTPKVKTTGLTHVTPTEEALTSALGEGPVAVCIDAGKASFQLYKSGVYDEPKCSKTVNHGVAAVGYGTQNGQDYYIVKNSWGSSWGDKGYILMSRNKNNQCAIASVAYFPTGAHDAN